MVLFYGSIILGIFINIILLNLLFYLFIFQKPDSYNYDFSEFEKDLIKKEYLEIIASEDFVFKPIYSKYLMLTDKGQVVFYAFDTISINSHQELNKKLKENVDFRKSIKDFKKLLLTNKDSLEYKRNKIIAKYMLRSLDSFENDFIKLDTTYLKSHLISNIKFHNHNIYLLSMDEKLIDIVNKALKLSIENMTSSTKAEYPLYALIPLRPIFLFEKELPSELFEKE